MIDQVLRWLTWPLAALFIASAIVDAINIPAIDRFLPSDIPLPTIVAIALLAVLVWRAEAIEAKAAEIVKELSPAEATLKTTLERVDAVSAEAKTLAASLQQLRERIAQSDILLPGRLALMQKRFPDAVELFSEAVDRAPTSQEARWLLGVSLFRARRAREALPHLKTAVSETDAEQLQILAQCEHFLGYHQDAERHAQRAIDVSKPASQEALALLGSIQGELDPERARDTLKEALKLYPRSSPIRYELIKIEIDTKNFDDAIEFATEGYRLNERDAGALVARAEAKLRRGRQEEEDEILADLQQAERINKRDANLYRQKGELYMRRARASTGSERDSNLRNALDAYDAGVGNIKPGWLQAALLTAKSRVQLLLKDFQGAETSARTAVDVAPGHVSNHIALALARLAAGKWQPAVIAAEAGQHVGGWAGRVMLTAVQIIGHSMSGVEPNDLLDKLRTISNELSNASGKFEASESWEIAKQSVLAKLYGVPASSSALVTDIIALVDGTMPAQTFQSKWASAGA